jgi:hypothetical protein
MSDVMVQIFQKILSQVRLHIQSVVSILDARGTVAAIAESAGQNRNEM